ncbi:MAG: AmmeMemoRadiSam system radical SAM enzyme [Candidatus Hydrogenedentota bacterium]
MTTQLPLRDLLAEHTISASPELIRHETGQAIRCLACGHRCLIREGKAGICKVRFNQGGELRVPGGYVAGLQVDPIEKKPFFHAFPGRDALSFGMLGCDFHCGYCQNWVTSQALRDEKAVANPNLVDAGELVRIGLKHNTPVVVSTYNEPLITSDWAVQVFAKARDAGMTCGYVSNGNATQEVLEFLRPYVDLYKVDLKGFDDRNYRQLGGVLQNVLDSISRIKSMGFWIEIVTLLVPGFNDDPSELTDMARFIAGVSSEIPWHITAFHPDYKMTDPPRTTVNQLLAAYDIGKSSGLQFVYPGNLPGKVGDREHTFCSSCGALLVERRGFYVLQNHMKGSQCPSCKRAVPGVWESSPPCRSAGSGIPRSAW